MNIPDLLAVSARKFPNHEGLVTPDAWISYAEWDMSVNKLANQLRELVL